MQVVQDDGFPIDIGVQDVARQLERQTHRVAIVVMRDIMAPVHKRWPVFVRVRQVPVVNIDHAIAAVGFDDWSDQRDHALTNGFDVRTVINCQSIGQFH